MLKRYKLEVGDWSADGHGETESYYVMCNKIPGSSKDCGYINQGHCGKDTPYAKGCKKLGFELVKKYCADYEDNLIPMTIVDKIIFEAPKVKECLEGAETDTNDKGELCYWIHTDIWLRLYLAICEMGDPDFKYEIVEEEIAGRFSIGGYGLFS